MKKETGKEGSDRACKGKIAESEESKEKDRDIKVSGRSRKIADYGALTALAFLFAYLESLIPIPIGIPGIKIGLANIVVVAALYHMKAGDAFIIALLRIVLSGFTFGSIYSMIYSLGGGLLSFFGMLLLKKTKKFQVTGVSLAGGVLHNLGQLAVAALVLETGSLFYYLPFLLISGAVTGSLIGLAVQLLSPALAALGKYRSP